MTGPATFRFLNEERNIDESGWDPPAEEKLWRYNLHYFDDLNAAGAVERQQWHLALMERWIRENPPVQGTAWEPYPTSIRIVNWIKAAMGGLDLSAAVTRSLADQVRWLERNVEWHLLGNHLFANGKALLFSGLFFEGKEADRWLSSGCRITDRELDEQILADGGQFERSPMYQALAVEDLLDLLNMHRAFPAHGQGKEAFGVRLRERAVAALRWLQVMTHPDGTYARFNDCADGIAPPLADLQGYARRLGMELEFRATGDSGVLLGPSGYVRLESGRAVVIIDCAPVGPDYLPGHAHADTLSFEVSLGGIRVLTNTGTSRYGTGERRLFERGTRAHSTVEILGLDSSEVWSGFRVGRRAKPFGLSVTEGRVECAHDGYRHLSGGPVHRRAWELAAGSLVVVDQVDPPRPAIAYFHLGPGLLLRSAGRALWHVERAGVPLMTVEVAAGHAAVQRSSFAPEFGRLEETQCLTVGLDEGRALTRWSWSTDAHPVPH